MKSFAYALVQHAAKHGQVLDVVARTGSTNDDVRRMAAGGAPHGFTLVADVQTEGRGRRGRHWISPPGKNLMFSTLLRPRGLQPAHAGLLALAAAVAIVEACPAVPLQIKWPNDVLGPDGRKVAGILAEAEWVQGNIAWAVIGIGLNIGAAPELPTAACLADYGAEDERVNRAVRVIGHLIERCDQLVMDPDGVLDAWRSHAHTLGRRVTIDGITGVASDIDSGGALVVSTSTGLQRVVAGDVTEPG